MAANGISTQAFKQQRQVAKLNLARTNRTNEGKTRTNYDITQLPTQYATGDNFTGNVVDNANTGGLVAGRPWTA